METKAPSGVVPQGGANGGYSVLNSEPVNVVVVTDASWQALDETTGVPKGSAIVVQGDPEMGSIPGAQWIWDTEDLRNDDDRALFEKTVTLPSNATNITAWVDAKYDGGGNFYANGTTFTSGIDSHSVHNIVPGENVIRFVARDRCDEALNVGIYKPVYEQCERYSGVTAKLTISYTLGTSPAPSSAPSSVPSPLPSAIASPEPTPEPTPTPRLSLDAALPVFTPDDDGADDTNLLQIHVDPSLGPWKLVAVSPEDEFLVSEGPPGDHVVDWGGAVDANSGKEALLLHGKYTLRLTAGGQEDAEDVVIDSFFATEEQVAVIGPIVTQGYRMVYYVAQRGGWLVSSPTATSKITAIHHVFRIKNAPKAAIDTRKFTEYALNPLAKSEKGRQHAADFEKALGFNLSNWQQLYEQIKWGVVRFPPTEGKINEFGKRFTVNIPVIGPNGQRRIVTTGWIYLKGSNIPSMTTVFLDSPGHQAKFIHLWDLWQLYQ